MKIARDGAARESTRAGHQDIARLHVLQGMHQGQVVTRSCIDGQGHATKGVLLGNGRAQAEVQGPTAAHGVNDEARGRARQRLHLPGVRSRKRLSLDQGGNIDHAGPPGQVRGIVSPS